MPQRPTSGDAPSSHRGSWYVKWRPRLRLAHEAVWVGAWFAGGAIALAMGRVGEGVAGITGGSLFVALSAAAGHRQAKLAARTANPCPCGSGVPYGVCHGGLPASPGSNP
jgi:hypothetical protein